MVGHIQNAIYDASTGEVPQLRAASLTTSVFSNPRLSFLTTKQPPTGNSTRDDIVLFLAHAAIWTAHCAVHGGFVRDWVIRGQPANDIDALLSPKISVTNARNSIVNAAKQRGIQLVQEKPKGPAHTLVFDWQGNSIEMDIADPTAVNAPPPGVDCDAGNLMIVYPGILKKKVEAAGGNFISVHKCIKHIQQQKFVYFYNLAADTDGKLLKRLIKKYFERNWTCISDLPSLAALNKYQHLIKPKPQYSKKWWALPD